MKGICNSIVFERNYMNENLLHEEKLQPKSNTSKSSYNEVMIIESSQRDDVIHYSK
jgi:hypothetical protein